MKSAFYSLCLASLGMLLSSSSAGANGPGGYAGQGAMGYPFVPFGLYQPYGAHYGNSLRTPPYFALNPPVYYGARYSRPYGLSPFAAPPMMDAPADYRGRQATTFVRPPLNNPYITESCGNCVGDQAKPSDQPNLTASATSVGLVQLNPFAGKNQATVPSRIATR